MQQSINLVPVSNHHYVTFARNIQHTVANKHISKQTACSGSTVSENLMQIDRRLEKQPISCDAELAFGKIN